MWDGFHIMLCWICGHTRKDKIRNEDTRSKVGVAEIELRWICGHIRNDKVRNEDTRSKVGVAEIEGNMRENRLRWFRHGWRGRGRPRRTLKEILRKDLEYLDRTEDVTQNQVQQHSKIHIADPT
ncbi:hypothetical protein DVH24_005832 [Malus domestica]|uniref:Uncharacterized protein n=1 Tax=Malus domestica TaxID=3750 RepID=A0A498IK79_MALDO|nr:hypothetical protein DVH24_005832 [Malus domestica]